MQSLQGQYLVLFKPAMEKDYVCFNFVWQEELCQIGLPRDRMTVDTLKATAIEGTCVARCGQVAVLIENALDLELPWQASEMKFIDPSSGSKLLKSTLKDHILPSKRQLKLVLSEKAEVSASPAPRSASIAPSPAAQHSPHTETHEVLKEVSLPAAAPSNNANQASTALSPIAQPEVEQPPVAETPAKVTNPSTQSNMQSSAAPPDAETPQPPAPTSSTQKGIQQSEALNTAQMIKKGSELQPANPTPQADRESSLSSLSSSNTSERNTNVPAEQTAIFQQAAESLAAKISAAKREAAAQFAPKPVSSEKRVSFESTPSQVQQPVASTSKQPATTDPRLHPAKLSPPAMMQYNRKFPQLSKEQIVKAFRQQGGDALRAEQQMEAWAAEIRRNQVSMNPSSQTAKVVRPPPTMSQPLHLRKKPRIDSPSAVSRPKPIPDQPQLNNKGKGVANAFAPVRPTPPSNDTTATAYSSIDRSGFAHLLPSSGTSSSTSNTSQSTSACSSSHATIPKTVFRETPPDSSTPPIDESSEEDVKPNIQKVKPDKTARRTSAGPRLHSKVANELVNRNRFKPREDATSARRCWCQFKTDTYYPVIIKHQAPEQIREADPTLQRSERTLHSVMLYFPGENVWYVNPHAGCLGELSLSGRSWWEEWTKLLPLGRSDELDHLLIHRAPQNRHMQVRYDLAMGKRPSTEGITRWL